MSDRSSPPALGLTLAAAAALCAVLGPALRAQDPPAADPSTTPLDLLNGAPYVELELGGAKGWFLLDTGANASGVDRGWLEEKKATYQPGGKGRIRGTTGSVAVEKAIFERFRLGNGVFPESTWVVHDYSKFTPPPGGPQAGLLGTDFLRTFQVTVDYTGRRARFLKQDERGEVDRSKFSPAVLSWINGHPTVSVRVGGKSFDGLDLPCRLDSGASYLSPGPFLDVNEHTVSALRAAGAQLKRTGAITLRGVSGPEKRELLAGDLTLEIGPLRLSDVTLVVHTGSGALSVDGPLTLASSSVLARMGTWTIDPFDHLLWVARPH